MRRHLDKKSGGFMWGLNHGGLNHGIFEVYGDLWDLTIGFSHHLLVWVLAEVTLRLLWL